MLYDASRNVFLSCEGWLEVWNESCGMVSRLALRSP